MNGRRQIPKLRWLREKGIANGVNDLSMISKEEAEGMEPRLRCQVREKEGERVCARVCVCVQVCASVCKRVGNEGKEVSRVRTDGGSVQ
jgi:hypothetical protein